MKVIAKKQDVLAHKTNVLVIPVFEGKKPNQKQIDKKLNNEISRLIKAKEFKAELKETNWINTHAKLNAKNILLLGLGKKKELKTDDVRKAYAVAAKNIKNNYNGFSIVLPNTKFKNIAQIITEGIVLGCYDFNKYKTVDKDKIKKIDSVIILNANSKDVKKGRILAENTNAVRDLVNESADKVTPTYLANYAKKIAKASKKTTVKIFDEKKIKKMKMGGLMAVSKGSSQKPRFVILDYKGKEEKPIILIGKGITFDAGGLDIKPAKYMEDMRSDMGGAATVIQTIKAAQDLNLKRHVIAIAPTCENLLGENAFKQGDIIKSYNGKTIEVKHTDAEGRLILADALGYADKNYKANAIIDIATLTGASIYALGYEIAALMSKDDKLKKDLIEASKKADEYMWELPMIPEYGDLVKGDIGDVRNIAKERPGPGVITAGIFLSNFVKQKWAHIDIGAAGWTPQDRDYKKKGGTGHCLRTFIEFLE
jgi:leucyl aminopeptidase